MVCLCIGSSHLLFLQKQRRLLPHLYFPLHRHDDLPDRIHSVAQRTAPSSCSNAQRQYLHPHGSRSVPDDTPTNLWPSIHVYNSLGAHFAIIRSKCFEKKKGIRIGSLILASSIIMATMFIKQHSVFDVITAFVMAAVMYTLVYRYDLLIAVREFRNKRKAKPQIG